MSFARYMLTHVIYAFELWLDKNEHQRVLWPSTIRLSHEYFDSLKKHAVPLNEADFAALAHTAMGSTFTPGWRDGYTA